MLLSDIAFLGTSVIWTAPPPAWTPTGQNDIRTVDMPVRNGSTQVHLRWTYTITDGSVLATTTFSIDNGSVSDDIGTIFHSLDTTTVSDKNNYRVRFNISTTEVATLIINKVTEREEAVYQCQLVTTSSRRSYKIRVIVTGELWIRIDMYGKTIENAIFLEKAPFARKHQTVHTQYYKFIIL